MLNEEKSIPTLGQEVKVKVDIVTSDDIKIYYTGTFQDFTARYIIKRLYVSLRQKNAIAAMDTCILKLKKIFL